MSTNLAPEIMSQLKAFIELCVTNPSILNDPEYDFLKSFIEFFGGTVPKGNTDGSLIEKSENTEDSKMSEAESEPELESDESDLKLDMSGVIKPDVDAPQKMGNLTLQPTEEEIAESQAKRSEAVSAFAEKDYEKAIELYTEAIVLNPQASLLYTKRGQVFLLLNRLNACIRDCNRALELNPDSAGAHKFRGRAYHLLGKFEEAATDLRLACKFDFDEQADEWLREVTPNAQKIEEHKRKMGRKINEEFKREKQEKLRKAQEDTKAYEDNTRTSQTETGEEPIFFKSLDDPDVVESLRDPEIKAALKEIATNPINFLKYQNNPKLTAFFDKMASNFGGVGGMPGGMPDCPGAEGASQPSASKPQPQDDDGLD